MSASFGDPCLVQLVTCGSHQRSKLHEPRSRAGPFARTGIPCDFAHARISAVRTECSWSNLTVVPPARLCNGTVPRVRASCSLSSSGAGPRSAPKLNSKDLDQPPPGAAWYLARKVGRHATQANESGTMKSSATTAGQLRTTAATINDPPLNMSGNTPTPIPPSACGSLPRDPPKSFLFSRQRWAWSDVRSCAPKWGRNCPCSPSRRWRGRTCRVAARSVPLPAPPRARAVLREWDHIRVGCGFQHVADHGDAVPAEQRIKAVVVILRERHDGCSDLAAACLLAALARSS